MLIRCNDLSAPIEFSNCPEVLETLRASVSGWSLTPWDDAGNAVPSIRVTREDKHYRLESSRLDGSIHEPSAVSAACSLIVDIVNHRVHEDPELVCLHAGAIRFGDRVLLFPSTYRAGKSTLLARLAMAGHTVVADDVVPIARSPEGLVAIAPGVAPRLRLPLPETFEAGFRDFAERCRGPEDAYYRYLSLPENRLAAHGERFGIGGFVFLERDTDSPPRLVPVDRGKALHYLLRQNFGRAAPAGDILDRFEKLVLRCGCYRLRYSDLGAAARLLSEAFGDWRPEDFASAPTFDDEPVTAGRRDSVLPPEAIEALLAEQLVQSAGIGVRQVGGEVFLTDDRAGSIFGLDGIGPAVWQLLEEPITLTELVDILAEAFPVVDRRVILGDVAALIGELLGRDLVVRVGSASPVA